MQTVALISQKGGTGKTTLAIALAVAAHLRGLSVAILDTDPQTNAANWGDRRGQSETFVALSVGEGQIARQVEALRSAGADLVIIDTAGKASNAGTMAAQAADIVLIPAQSQVFDLETLAAVKTILGMAGNPPAYVVVTKAHPSARNPVQDAAEVIGEAFGLAVAPVAMVQRRVYAVAPETGQGPQEIEKDGKATAEIAELLDFVCKHTSIQPKKARA